MHPRAILHAAIVWLAILASAAPTPAQSDISQPAQSSADAGKQIQVSGCLRRGNNGTYYLSDQDGRKWLLSSTTVNLAQHVMHAVTVTGKPAPVVPSQIGRKPQPGEDSAVNSSRPLDVLSLKMLSPSCTR